MEPSLEDRAEHIKAALAEAGYPDAFVGVRDGGVHIGSAPDEMIYKAVHITGGTSKCWACWDGSQHVEILCTPGDHAEDCAFWS